MSYDEFINAIDGNKLIEIKFDKILETDEIDHMNIFTLKKRSYYTITDLILNSIRMVFNRCGDKVILPYLQVAFKIKDLEKEYTIDEFFSDLATVINNDDVKNAINEYVSENYVDEMDKSTEEVKNTKKIKINQELQFTDEHVRILLKSADAIRLCIPLITEYCELRKQEVNEILYDAFQVIIAQYQGEVVMINKLHRFIYSRVVSTQYSDKTIWNLLVNKSKDIHVITSEFLKDVIIGILPKSIFDKNIINLLHVVIKKKISFEFQKNHKITFNPVNLNQVDSEGLTQFDRWEIGLTKKNENKIIINQLSISFEIKNILKQFGMKISKQEFEYYEKNIIINKPQTNILFLFFSKYMGSYYNLNNCNRKEYILLVIIMYKWLRKYRYHVIASYLIGIPDKLSERKMNTRSTKIIESIITSKDYMDLLKYKYSLVNTTINNSGVIIKLIGNLNISKYLYLVPYEDYVAKKNLDRANKEIDYRIELISNQFLDFIKTI